MRYYGRAVLLGIGWFVVLLIPGSTRAWLLEPRDASLNLLALVAACVLTAGLFRAWIKSAGTLGASVARAVTIPWIGCVIYLTLYNVYAGTLDFLGVGRINLRDSAVLYLWGLLYAALAGWVVLPYSFLCQWLLNRSENPHQRLRRVAHPE